MFMKYPFSIINIKPRGLLTKYLLEIFLLKSKLVDENF